MQKRVYDESSGDDDFALIKPEKQKANPDLKRKPGEYDLPKAKPKRKLVEKKKRRIIESDSEDLDDSSSFTSQENEEYD